MSDFDSMYAQFQSALNHKAVETSEKFQFSDNLKDKILYMWNLPEFHDHIKFEIISPIKSDDISATLRLSGNDYYRKNKLEKALEYYNESIINAQYCLLNDSAKPSILSYAFANRSAVFFEMKLYCLCLADIKRCFQQKFPIHLHDKILIREIKCHIAQNDMDSAKDAYERCISNTIYCQNRKLLYSLGEHLSTFKKAFKEVNLMDREIASLQLQKVKNSNKCFPSISDALEFVVTENGRGFKAKRDIMPGELLIKENAYAAVLLNSCLLTHCSYCLARIKYAPLPCTICTNVVFCDETCRENGAKLFHDAECSLLSTFEKLEMGNNSSIALRILCQTGWKEILRQFLIYEKERSNLSMEEFGVNSEGVYDPNDFRPIFHLVKNENLRKVPDLFKRSAMSLTIFKLLVSRVACDNIPEISVLNLSYLSPEQLHLATILYMFSMSLPCNAHSITEYNDSSIAEIGSGAFATFSLVNHSCNPNMVRSTFGTENMGFATQLITAGSEIFDSYGPCFAHDNLAARRRYLYKQYYFLCMCNACEKDWPLYDCLPDALILKCPFCSSRIMDNCRCEDCHKLPEEQPILENNKIIEFSIIIKTKEQLYKQFCNFKENLDKSHTITDIQFILKIISFANRYCVEPNRIIMDAKELLKMSLDKVAYLNEM